MCFQCVKITFILFKCHRFIDNFNDFYLFSPSHEKAHDNREFSHEMSNFAINHKSQPVKLNPHVASEMPQVYHTCVFQMAKPEMLVLRQQWNQL